MEIERVVKYKPCKRANMARVTQDVRKAETLAREPNNPERMAWNLHLVPVDDERYLVADAKYLNKHTNQKGRGNLRMMIGREDYQYVGLALELDNGNYRRVA
ncbi:MAG: hypothetical protein OEL87_00465 [Nanoarchaeota archaeon]|nr:hypothetical protein [Nanoarchaeota archaeon]